MSTTVKTGWLNDKNGDKFAPKTLASQVQTSDGILLEDKIQADLDAVKNVQADWEQNDNTNGSYINNRPFCVIGTTEVTLLDGTFEFNPQDIVYEYRQNFTTVFETGKEYTVIFDGVNYTCTAYNMNGDDMPILGNSAIVTSSSTDTGEPFIIGTNGVVLIVATKLTDASHTVTIKTNEENIKKIDLKYLPDFNYLSKDSPVGTGSFSLNRKADTIIGENSFAEGSDTTASGNSSHAEGSGTTASGDSSHAEGPGTTASGNYSHAEGFYTTVSGDSSHAEGNFTTVSGDSSHAEGFYTKVLSDYSHAEGHYTIASGSNSQHVQGRYNIKDVASVYAHIVGNGTSSSLSNAHTLDWSGNAWFQGDVYTGSTSGAYKDEGSKKLATEEYVDTLNSLWYGTCATASATAAKVVTTTTGDFTLKEGATIYVLFNNDNTSTSSITLNVDGTGDIAVNLNSTNGMTAYQIAVKQVICFVYDGESFRVQGGSLATTTYYGLTKLSSSTNSTSTTMAATPSAVKEAYDLASAAVPVSGGTMTGVLTAQNNTSYTTKQVRNIILVAEGDSLPSGSNGDICLVYTP